MLLWLGVQTGLTMPLGIGLENAIRGFAPDFELRGFFNPLAWQLVFFSGMVLGALTATKRIDWSRVFRAERIEIVVMALGVMAFFMVWRLGFTFGLVPDPMVQAFARFDNRADFGFVYLINFAATAYVVTWLLMVGREAAHPAFRRTAEVMHKVAAFPFLTFIGKHSLQVYTYHLLVVYLMVSFDWWYGPFDQATKTIVTVALIASLAIPAWIHANLPRLGDAVRRAVSN